MQIQPDLIIIFAQALGNSQLVHVENDYCTCPDNGFGNPKILLCNWRVST